MRWGNLAKTSLGIVLEYFLQMRWGNLAKTSLRIVFEYLLQMRWGNLAKTSLGIVLEYFWRQGFDSKIIIRGKWKRVSPRGSRPVDCKERMYKMRMYGVYIYPVKAQSSESPIGERLQIAVFALGSFDRRAEVRNGGFSGLLRFCD